jgi:V8-like Glu-specific endopeptidase
MLTAKHVLDIDDNGLIDGNEILRLEQESSFWFFNWIEGCNGTLSNWNTLIYYGANLVSQSLFNDMVLIELRNPPGIGDGVTYAGWNRGGTLPAENGSFVAHHPAGDPMKGAWTRNVNHYVWDATKWSVFYQYGDQGAATEGGSSGSALLNEYDQVVGTLWGGLSSCGNQSLGDIYEKLSEYWQNSTLSYYLSPSNLNSIPGIVTYNMTINGDEYIPCTGSVNFSVPNFIGCSFSWSVSSNLQIVAGSGTNSIQVQRLNNSSETGFVSVSITDSKGYSRTFNSIKFLKMVPDLTGTINTCLNRDAIALGDYNSVCGGVLTKIYMSEPVLSWSLIAGTPNSWSTFGTANNLQFNINQYDNVSFEVTTTNGCQTFTRVYYFEANQEMGLRMFQIYPNPSSSHVKIEPFVDRLKTGTAINLKQVIIQNMNGRVFVDKKLADNVKSTVIDLLTLPKDHYIIRIFDGKKWYVEKLIVDK